MRYNTLVVFRCPDPVQMKFEGPVASVLFYFLLFNIAYAILKSKKHYIACFFIKGNMWYHLRYWKVRNTILHVFLSRVICGIICVYFVGTLWRSIISHMYYAMLTYYFVEIISLFLLLFNSIDHYFPLHILLSTYKH